MLGQVPPEGDSLAPAAAVHEPAHIAVTGSGTVTGVPDRFAFDLSVHFQAANVSTALGSANDAMHAVLRALGEQGVAAEDVKTAGLSVEPTMDYRGNDRGVVTGYEASQHIAVLVRSLTDAGGVITAAADAGGNAVRLLGGRLQVGGEEALRRQAREAAFTDARGKAEQYAAAAGRHLEDVLAITEGHARGAAVPLAGGRLLAESMDSDVPIRAGTAEVSATVTVVWRLG